MRPLKLAMVAVVCLATAAVAPQALAYNPVLSLSSSSGNMVLSVSNAAPNSPIQLIYTSSGSSLPTTVSNFGNTDSSGNFTTNVSSSSYGLSSASQIYVTIGGQQSNIVSGSGGYYGGCAYNCGSPYGLSLSQTNVSVSVGQTATVTATNNYSTLHVSNNSNPTAATAYVSGNSISINGQNSGSTTLTVCSNNNGACATVYVTVNGSGGYGGGNIWFSPSSPTMYVGQSLAVSINSGVSSGYASPGYGNSYYISSNSNSNVVTASVVGTVLNLTAYQNGSSNISVCHSSLSFCGTLNVTVGNVLGASNYQVAIQDYYFSPNSMNVSQGASVTWTNNGMMAHTVTADNGAFNSGTINPGASFTWTFNTPGTYYYHCNFHSIMTGSVVVTGGGSGGGSLGLSQNNVSLSLGQSTTVTAYNQYGSAVYVSQNSNPATVSTSISGNVVYINSLAAGSSTLTICSNYSSGQCGTVYVTVTGGGGGSLSFSPPSPTVVAGQTINVSIYNSYASSGYFVSNNSNPNAASATISGTNVIVYGYNSGTANITVCSNGSGQCGVLFVTVNGSGSGSNIYFTPASLNLTIGQSSAVTVSGPYAYNFTISSNSNPTIASAVMQGNTLTVTGMNSGYTTFSVCQNGLSQCGNLGVTVNTGGGYGGGYGGSLSLSQTTAGMTVGQTLSITAYNYGNSVYISNNTNPNVVSASVSGNQISLRGQASGSATVTVCAYNASQCGSIYATVTGVSYTGGSLQYPGGGVLGASTYPNGQLISENGTVYIVYKNTKSGFVSAAAFRGFGFSFANVIYISNSGLTDSGYVLQTANSSHPWGSWIKSGRTVYFVHDSGLVPVPDWNTFLNNGGQANLIVPANRFDFTLPILSPMTLSDSRMN